MADLRFAIRYLLESAAAQYVSGVVLMLAVVGLASFITLRRAAVSSR